ncbi:MAG: SOS response-associated peptidase [Flammeovirgaceae bacterium]|nr:SOS response-associated peptidase [Flammeovirgaceae bacterium]
MIERYSLTASKEKIAERFAIDVPDFYQPKYNAAPAQLLPVITTAAPQGLSYFYWGESPSWAKNKTLSERIINIQAERLIDKPMLKKALMRDRCIVPADGFYAWKKVAKKSLVPYRFTLINQEDIFSIPALWEEYEDDRGEMIHTFSIITIESHKTVQAISERMPVMFSKEQEIIWLDKSVDESQLINLLKPGPADQINLYTVSPRIFDSTANHHSLVIPAPAADQFGNLTLFD